MKTNQECVKEGGSKVVKREKLCRKGEWGLMKHNDLLRTDQGSGNLTV